MTKCFMGNTTAGCCSSHPCTYADDMNKTPRFATIAVAAVVSIFTLAGCAPAQPSEALRIGVEGPLTGDQAPTGQGMLNGALLAANEINAEGGVNG